MLAQVRNTEVEKGGGCLAVKGGGGATAPVQSGSNMSAGLEKLIFSSMATVVEMQGRASAQQCS